MIQRDEARRPLTVSELASEVKRALRPLTAILVKGEVSGMKRTAKGNYTFAVKDPGAVVQAFLYGADARKLGIVPEDGQVFVFRGRMEFWQSGALNLIVDFIQFDDVGRMRAQLEALKRRLELEGAFSVERKRRLPFLPRVVALVTSPTSLSLRVVVLPGRTGESGAKSRKRRWTAPREWMRSTISCPM